MRTPLVAANWKMYKTIAETQAFFREFGPLVDGRRRRRDRGRAAVPRACTRRPRRRAARSVGVAAQDLYWEREGAFTGEVSAGDAERGRRRATSSSATPSGGRCSARPTST